MEAPKGYESLCEVLGDAVVQASMGKGRERHAEAGEPFDRQIICEVARRVGLGYPLGQACKKIYESQRLDPNRGIAELLGAINYLAAAVIVMREEVAAEKEEAKRDHEFLEQALAPKSEGCEELVQEDEPEYEPHQIVQVQYAPHRWCNAQYVCRASRWGHVVLVPGETEEQTFRNEDVRPALSRKTQELYQRIVDVNPATYGHPHNPTGEELAEIAEGEAHD